MRLSTQTYALVFTVAIVAQFSCCYAQTANCPGVNNEGGLNCTNPNACCGSGTLSPSCTPADGSTKCCLWYLSATQCAPNDVCGGSGGAGASSYAQCGPSGSTFCVTADDIFGQNSFCSADQICCSVPGRSFCCDAGTTCGNETGVCNSPAPPPTPAPSVNNCPGVDNEAGLNCSNANACCGAGTLSPSCTPADGSTKCCVWYLSSTQCAADDVCGGSGGAGASSYAQCGPPGSTQCVTADDIFGQNTFCTADQICCSVPGESFCCDAGTTCGNQSGICNAGGQTSAPTSSPTASSSSSSCPASHVCGASDKCCNDVNLGPTCYDPIDYSCFSTSGHSVLCSSSDAACGSICYDPREYSCSDNAIHSL